MATLQVLTRDHFAGKRWRRFESYHFAAGDAVCPLVAQEWPKAALAFPIGFLLEGGGYQPVGVLGLAPGKNLYVLPDGRWLAAYVPAAYRGYPFALANTPEGQSVLCVHADSGLITEYEGDPLFTANGQLNPAVGQILDFFGKIAADRQATQRICAQLQQHGLIQPWPITLKTPEGERKIDGLHRIDEAALNQLDAPTLKALQQSGALVLAYCQLLSMSHLESLGRLADRHAKAAQAEAPGPALNLDLISRDGILHFGG